MKWTKYTGLAVLAFVLMSGVSLAQSVNYEREQSDASKMLHKLGRGFVNVVTCWVEIPRNIAIEWENTDPVSGLFVGGIEGIGWGFARFASGVYEVVTFPIPVPAGYKPMMEPEFCRQRYLGRRYPVRDRFPLQRSGVSGHGTGLPAALQLLSRCSREVSRSFRCPAGCMVNPSGVFAFAGGR